MTKAATRLSPTTLGFAMGMIWGLSLFVLGLIGYGSMFYGHPMIQMISSVYLGYGPTVEGAFIGFAWGFVDFFMFGWLAGLVYNACLRHKSA